MLIWSGILAISFLSLFEHHFKIYSKISIWSAILLCSTIFHLYCDLSKWMNRSFTKAIAVSIGCKIFAFIAIQCVFSYIYSEYCVGRHTQRVGIGLCRYPHITGVSLLLSFSLLYALSFTVSLPSLVSLFALSHSYSLPISRYSFIWLELEYHIKWNRVKYSGI